VIRIDAGKPVHGDAYFAGTGSQVVVVRIYPEFSTSPVSILVVTATDRTA
jgi:hypothetical protein